MVIISLETAAGVDKDGDYWMTGRVDDILNVSGHRLGTAEIESAICNHPSVSESAVVGFPHDIKGQGIQCFVVIKPDQRSSKITVDEIRDMVRKRIGPIASPDKIIIVTDLPKTRSGKIMRRLLRKIASNETLENENTTTLANPEVLDELLLIKTK